jgi:polysaccharide export outer membrane protein
LDIIQLESVVYPNVLEPAARADAIRVGPRAALTLAMVVLMLCGCAATRGDYLPYGADNLGPPDAPPAARVEEERIHPADELHVVVFQVNDLSGDFQVDLNGNIKMPLIGDVKAVDLTTNELEAELAKQVRPYVKNPVVSVAVKTSNRPGVTVEGSVNQPGIFPITGPLTLIQSIALARGLDDDANPRRVAIFRRVGGKRMGAAFDLQSIRRGEMADPDVYSGDIVVVDGSKTREDTRMILQAIPIIGVFAAF